MTTSRTESNRSPRFVLAPRAISVACDETSIRVTLADGREISAALAWFPSLLAATPAQRDNWAIIGDGEGIHWPDVDEDISVASFLGLPSD